MVEKGSKDFSISGKLYFWGSVGIMARALFAAVLREELQHVHDLSYGDNDSSLYGYL